MCTHKCCDFCDLPVNKDRYVASLTVDGVQGADGQSSNTGQSEANTNDPLYFGGLPSEFSSSSLPFSKFYQTFCINIFMNKMYDCVGTFPSKLKNVLHV